jgi:hypothetical protein
MARLLGSFFSASKPRTFVDIDIDAGVNGKVCLESTVTVVVKFSRNGDTLQNLRKSVKLSQNSNSLGRNCGNI